MAVGTEHTPKENTTLLKVGTAGTANDGRNPWFLTLHGAKDIVELHRDLTYRYR